MRSHFFHLTTILLATVLLSASSCEGNDPFIDTPEEEAARILANTPTELPPITTTGENTMGAWIIPQPGSELALEAGTDSILFVASGVERIDPIGASSTDCNAFQNYRYESQGFINVRGNWCERPEIDDERAMTLDFSLFSNYAVMGCGLDLDGKSSLNELKFKSDTLRPPSYSILFDDQNSRILSATLDSVRLYGWYNTEDSLTIKNTRIDVTYGSTP